VALRPLLFSLSYQMTGSVADGEDLVSESYLRLRRAREHGTIQAIRSILNRDKLHHLGPARRSRVGAKNACGLGAACPTLVSILS
jgi:hypothetical protein